jgi:hypothetical protein
VSAFARRAGGAWRAIVATLALCATVSMPGGAQQQAERAGAQESQPPTRPTFRVEANYVRVDVYPTLKGEPVRDLTKDDFEVLEDGAVQKIDQFEFIQIRGNVPEPMKREPQTVTESREMAQDPRARVFIVFLDTYHTGLAGSHRMRSARSRCSRGCWPRRPRRCHDARHVGP